MGLAKDICGMIDSEDDFKVYLDDTDFINRPLLKIITENKFAEMLSSEDPKSQNIMNNLFVGSEGSKCDGNIYGYSTFMHVLKSKPVRDSSHTFMQTLTIGYATEKANLDYKFQHKYTRLSIQTYFYKDLFFSFIMTFVCQVWPLFIFMGDLQ